MSGISMDIEGFNDAPMPEYDTREYDKWYLTAYETGYEEVCQAYIEEQEKGNILEEEAEAAEKQIADLKEEIKETKDKVEAMEKTIAELKAEKEKMANVIKDFCEVEKTQQENKKLKEQVKALQEELSNFWVPPSDDESLE